jgi:hypothetical protein
MIFKAVAKKSVEKSCYGLDVMKNSHKVDHSLFHVWCCTPLIDKDTMVLQNYTNSEKVLVGPCGEIYPACHAGTQATDVKAEEVSDAAEEEDALPIAIQEIKAEPEVSCVFALLGR